MTLNGAIMQLVEMRENSMMPEIFKPYFDKVIETISECEEPSAQPERKTGRWIRSSNKLVPYYCSSCTGRFNYEWNFCPNCGAKMLKEGENIDS